MQERRKAKETASSELDSGELYGTNGAATIVKDITKQIEDYNTQAADDLLNRIREAEPQFFEHLVVDLLVKMGYQGVNGNSIVTSQSHDGVGLMGLLIKIR